MEELKPIPEPTLQCIVGVDKNNPTFTVYRDVTEGRLHVYWGQELLEVVNDDRDCVDYKLLVARLYNAGLKIKTLGKQFGDDPKTMKRWANALKEGNVQKLALVLAGRSASRKLTNEIRCFARMRFEQVYAISHYGYSQIIRSEVKAIFDVSLSSETLRPLFKELREKHNSKQKKARSRQKRERECDCSNPQPVARDDNHGQSNETAPQANRRQFPDLFPAEVIEPKWRYHLGVLLLSQSLIDISQLHASCGWILKQWMACLFCGALNIERTKFINFEDLQCFIGYTQSTLKKQRDRLGSIADETLLKTILRDTLSKNQSDKRRTFYYDPHTKHYTGMAKVLKGWCPTIRFADKVLHSDFIHTLEGYPVFFTIMDNYQTMRERFIPNAEAFIDLLELPQNDKITLIVDREIAAQWLYQEIIDHSQIELVSWEKNFKSDSFDFEPYEGELTFDRCVNNAQTLRTYRFRYRKQLWKKNPKIQQWLVEATNPKKKSIKVSVLATDLQACPEQVILPIFKRWTQENDFKYLDKHFGINAITSYKKMSFEKLAESLKEKEECSGAYKACEVHKANCNKELKKLLLEEHRNPGRSSKRKNRINELDIELKKLGKQMEETERKSSRLQRLVDENYERLETRSKEIMDAIKITSRNSFYQAMEPFKKAYNNYRDDHDYYRLLTQSDGILIERESEVEAHLMPKANLSPAMQVIMREYLEKVNENPLTMPDGSGRKIIFRLGDKSGFKLAFVNPE
jgi:transposase